jgi:hypothetical protein
VTLPAYLSDIHHATGKSQLRLDSRGVVERWLNKDEWLSWSFQASSSGTFDVVAITSGQKYGKNWEGGHKVSVQTAGQNISGAITDGGKVDNPSNPYWPYIKSNLGQVKIPKAGKYDLALKPESIESAQGFGFTLVSIQLIPR